MGRRAKPPKGQAEAKESLSGQSPKNEGAEVRDLEKRLAESLEREKATSEILRVISSSPTNVTPVFQVIVEHARRLCDGVFANVVRLDGGLMHNMAHHGFSPEGEALLRQRFPMPPSEGMSGRAILARAVVHAENARRDAELGTSHDLAKTEGFRSMVSVPMLQGGTPLGAITVARRRAGRFPERQVQMLQAFADQAVIAIENVRLFNETNEALEQQTATGDILRVIASSPTDVQPVFDAIVRTGARLCEADFALLARYDGTSMSVAAHSGATEEEIEAVGQVYPMRPTPETLGGRAILERAVVHIPDVRDDPTYGPRVIKDAAWRTGLGVPLLREGAAIGAVGMWRRDVRPFSDRQIALLRTFADQAVIAIENVRLFTELRASNRELTTALDTQTATSEILRVISRSPTEVQPVLDAIVRSAARLCGAVDALLVLAEDDEFVYKAHEGPIGALLDVRLPLHGTVGGRAILESRVVQVEDLAKADDYPVGRETAERRGYRTVLSVPLLRDGVAIGAITIRRAEVLRFSDQQVELLQTFADQAVIAIENARLFDELQARTAELVRSVEQLTALGEVGRAVSSTLDLDTVLTTIVTRAVQLSGLEGGVIFEYDEGTEEFVQRAETEQGGELAAARRARRIRRGQGVVGQTAVTLETAQVPDILPEGAYASPLRENLIQSGIRAVLAVPMLWERRLIGSLVVSRNTPGEFPPETVDLLRTFATQSALAIQNARLFREIEEKSRELEAASRHKSEFLANMSHELRTPLNAIIGYSELLEEEAGDLDGGRLVPDLQKIAVAAKHQLSLINDILDLSKIEAGRMELELTDFDLPGAIDNALTLVRERATRRGITLGRAIDDRVGVIRGDERKVKQVLLNLLSNALKFTPEGGRIDVHAGVHDEVVEVSVTDTGVGIAPEDQEAVFEEFRQVGTADKKIEGTGLGLALSRKFIELHGGRISVTSQIGQGSTFTFTLPVQRGHGVVPPQ